MDCYAHADSRFVEVFNSNGRDCGFSVATAFPPMFVHCSPPIISLPPLINIGPSHPRHLAWETGAWPCPRAAGRAGPGWSSRIWRRSWRASTAERRRPRTTRTPASGPRARSWASSRTGRAVSGECRASRPLSQLDSEASDPREASGASEVSVGESVGGVAVSLGSNRTIK